MSVDFLQTNGNELLLGFAFTAMVIYFLHSWFIMKTESISREQIEKLDRDIELGLKHIKASS